MGNIEEPEIRKEQLPKSKLQPRKNISDCKQNLRITKDGHHSFKPNCKANFCKINPVTATQIIVLEQLDDQPKIKNQLDQENVSLFQMVMKDQQSKKGRIQVNWNNFIKVKKKNYLEDYVFIKEIGKGAFGQVIKAKMKYGVQNRAIKMIKQPLLLKNQASKSKLYAQVSIPIELDHPNIGKIYQIFQWRKTIAIAMELCEGGDLFHFIKSQKKCSQSVAASLFKQIMSGVFYMHKKGICHRDLKPQNMLYDTQNKLLKIIDFGTAIKFTKDQVLKKVVGTPYYIAPQVIDGNYNQKCDIWSCGVILYTILSGTPPFNGKNNKQVMQKIKYHPVQFTCPIWKTKSEKCKQLVSQMLTRDPKKRPSAEQILSSPWFETTMTESSVDSEVNKQIVSNLKNFHFQNKLKAVVYTFIASQLYSNKDKQNLLKVFKQIDKDGDGVIQKQELIQIFSQGHSLLTSEQIDKILLLIDTNSSGKIDFTQFIVAASNEEQLLRKKQLESAFSYLDTDHSGYITINEVKSFLDGSEQTEEQIKAIFREVDDNGDGQISKHQFISLLVGKEHN